MLVDLSIETNNDETVKIDVIASIQDRHNLPKSRRFELYDKKKRASISLDQLDDVRSLHNRYFILVLLNESAPIDK